MILRGRSKNNWSMLFIANCVFVILSIRVAGAAENSPDGNRQGNSTRLHTSMSQRIVNDQEAHRGIELNNTHLTQVTIQNRTRCLEKTDVNVENKTQLSVIVDNCCVSNCTHEINIFTSKDHHLHLEFTDFNVPGKSVFTSMGQIECKAEALEIIVRTESIRNETRPKEFIVKTFCGAIEPTTEDLEHHRITLALVMKDNLQCIDKIHFIVTITSTTQKEQESCSLPQNVEKNPEYGHIISSPGFASGQGYSNNMTCRWDISVPNGRLLRLNVSSFRLGKGDFINISMDLIDRFIGQFPRFLVITSHKPLNFPIVLPSNKCVVEFKSDDVIHGNGFKLHYDSADVNDFIPLFDNMTLNCTKRATIPGSIKCNYVNECVNGKDEVDCDDCYTHSCEQCDGADCHYCPSVECLFDKKTYRAIDIGDDAHMSWEQATGLCRYRFNAHLVSLNTPEERRFYDKFSRHFKYKYIFLGLRRMQMKYLPQTHRRLWQWVDGQTAFYLPDEYRYQSWYQCTMFNGDFFHAADCEEPKQNVTIVCESINDMEWKNKDRKNNSSSLDSHQKSIQQWKENKFDVFLCGTKEVVAWERKCDRIRDCSDASDERECELNWYGKLKDTFLCTNWEMSIPYFSVCNGIDDCSDKSDEAFCVTPKGRDRKDGYAHCKSGMKIERRKLCNSIEDCKDGSDEEKCGSCSANTTLCPTLYCMPNSWMDDEEFDCPVVDWLGFTHKSKRETFKAIRVNNVAPPGVVQPDGYGKVNIESLDAGQKCPPTLFQCKDGFCIPLNFMCNMMPDCPHHEDEDPDVCLKACEGAYKCHGYLGSCVHYDNVCDGSYHCPGRDDELSCGENSCPEHCMCKQTEFNCTQIPEAKNESYVCSFFNSTNGNITGLTDLHLDSYSLIKLNVSHNNIRNLNPGDLNFYNLLELDLSRNCLTYIQSFAFQNCSSLIELDLAKNDIVFDHQSLAFLKNIPKLKRLVLSANKMTEIYPDSFQHGTKLIELYLREMKIEIIHGRAFSTLGALLILDLRNNPITQFSMDIFLHLDASVAVSTDNYRLCCQTVAPTKTYECDKCYAPRDEISSCDDMLRSTFLRVSLWLMATLTIFGNAAVIVHRVFWDTNRRVTFQIIITCLAISDFLMGPYLVIIGIADILYRDRFLAQENDWKNSIFCQTAGFLCVLSSEVSAIFILVATVDRVTAIAFPLHPRLQMSNRSTIAVSFLGWLTGLVIAILPLLSPFREWKLYSTLAVGTPLPITRIQFDGSEFSFGVFIILNMSIFICVVVGQIVIWISIKRRSKIVNCEVRAKQNLKIAQRLFLVVLTDCLCWFPVSVMGLMARKGIPIPGTMYIVTTVFLLPANSALNPFLYTINSLILRRKEKATDTLRRTE